MLAERSGVAGNYTSFIISCLLGRGKGLRKVAIWQKKRKGFLFVPKYMVVASVKQSTKETDKKSLNSAES